MDITSILIIGSMTADATRKIEAVCNSYSIPANSRGYHWEVAWSLKKATKVVKV
jgi:hypothetical protein